ITACSFDAGGDPVGVARAVDVGVPVAVWVGVTVGVAVMVAVGVVAAMAARAETRSPSASTNTPSRSVPPRVRANEYSLGGAGTGGISTRLSPSVGFGL